MAALASIGLSALEWVASHLLKKLLDECFASFGTDTEKKLQKLRDTVLPLLKSVIEKAEGSPNRTKLEDRLQRLKDAYDEGEDALDLLDYYRLRREVRYSSRIPKPVRCVAPILEGSQDMLSPRMIKLRRSLNKYEKIESEAEKLRAELGAVCESGQTTSVPPARVFGRDKDREEIIQRLKTEPAAATRDPGSSSSSGVPIIAIVGRPGIGKTTLAQYVYEQLASECGGGRFYPVMWVFSSRNFTASEIMKDIIQQASIASGSQDLGNLPSPEALQLRMKEQLKEKKFLLVIDDVRCDGEDHENNWKMLRCLSKCRSPGSKILVTSQTDHAPAKIGAAIGAAIEHTLHLEELEESGFLDLFIHYALPSGETDPCLREDLEENLETIARKLNKDPTAAETVGTTIATEIARLSRSQGDWRAYLERVAEEDWSGNKTKAFTWSYRQLPAHLQRCFAYCSLYPKGYRFEALELVQLWMAQGFIKPDDQNKRMEDAGDDYLKELVSRFYIQRLDRVRRSFGTDKPDSCYTLHELLYDLAEKVTRNYCVRIEGNRREKIPSTIRHLCIPADKLNENEEEICKLKKLRTLIVTEGESVTSGENVATDIFKSLKKLRVLVLELNLEDLAKFISEMKHLRILQVSSTSEFVLPESVCTLYQLQVLRVKSAKLLPKFLNNLVSLRYLEANFEKISVIPNISKLTSLQCLEKFPVSKEKGNGLEQLQNLNELQGCLCIANLENVKSKKSAISANLKDKKHLRMLQLVWCDGEDNVNPNMDAEILEGLQLPPNLTTLHLDGYRGRSWPSWPECQTSSIEELAPKTCGMLEELPPVDRLYPSRTSLELSHLSRLEALHTLPPRLKKIRIFRTPFLAFVTKEDLEMSPAKKRSIIEAMRKSMPEWFLHQHQESLVNDEKEMMNFIASTSDSNNNEAAEHNKSAPAADVAISDDWERWLEIHKRKMELIYNRKNEAKLLLPSNLTELTLKGCNITNHALSACLQTLTSLTCLELAEIRTITRLPSLVVLAKLKALQTLHIRDCWGATSLGGIKALHHLRNLLLIGCPCLDSETAFLPSSLQSILFESCADVDVILANADLPCLSDLMITRCPMRNRSLQLGALRSLRFLDIEHCRELSLLGGVQNLHSLKFLILNNCPNLQAVMNLPRSLKSLGIRRCPIFIGAIPVEDDFKHDLKCRKEVTDGQ